MIRRGVHPAVVLSLALAGACAPGSPLPTRAPATSVPPPPTPSKAPSEDAEPPPRESRPEAGPIQRVANAPPPSITDARGDRLPQDFQTDAMLLALRDDGAPVEATARILAWSIEVDDRPLVVDRVILWVRYSNSWLLAHLYRHPLDSAPNNTFWHVARVTDIAYTGQQSYSHAPTVAELDQFLKETWWKFQAEGGFRFLDAGICDDAWKEAMGSPPNHGFH